MSWQNLSGIHSKSFTCGYCSEKVASNVGYIFKDGSRSTSFIYICHHCKRPTYFDIQNKQTPGSRYGAEIPNLPEDIEALYKEARDSFSVNAFSSSVMCSRKILMHVAVAEGAEENKNFAHYVDYLSSNNIIPKNSKDWVDEIRNFGNDANHEIKINTEDDAKEILSFLEMLLKLVYEYPNRISSKGKTVK